MSAKCKAYSKSKLGLEPPDSRKAFYAGWDAAIAEAEQEVPHCNAGPDHCQQCADEKEAEQAQPVAWVSRGLNDLTFSKPDDGEGIDWVPLYTSPPIEVAHGIKEGGAA